VIETFIHCFQISPGRFLDAAYYMTELGDIFAELGISHYLHDFLEQGFDTWETILDITESDFDTLGVKLGHRRKLQRRIANTRGLSSDRALASPRNTPTDERQPEEQRTGGGTKQENKDGSGAQGAKRKYRRHPKPDENAPERPPSAYVIFSNKMREELKGRNLSFTEIAKLVGENWQNLSPGEKEPYEQQAFSAKEKYNNELAEYKKTIHYKEYAQYLADFKARQSNQQQAAESEAAKRPKLEAHASTTSSGTASSTASQHDGELPNGRMRVESSASSSGQWQMTDGHPSPQLSNGQKSSLGAPLGHSSSNTSSPMVLPGYRESIFGGNQQALPWRDSQREENIGSHHQLPRIGCTSDRRPSLPEKEKLNLTGSVQHAHRTGHSHPPPLLTSESTTRSSGSSASTVSSTFFSPRTPMEPPLERALPTPSLYPQKSSGSFESQLPPLRPPSLSPRSTMLGSQQSPNGIHVMDFPTTMPPMRGYTAIASHRNYQDDHNDFRTRDIVSMNSADDNLDPVSALIRAGEIVNRNSRGLP